MRAARSGNTWMITGGTDTGVMRLVGQAIANYALDNVTAVGIGPSNSDQLNPHPPLTPTPCPSPTPTSHPHPHQVGIGPWGAISHRDELDPAASSPEGRLADGESTSVVGAVEYTAGDEP